MRRLIKAALVLCGIAGVLLLVVALTSKTYRVSNAAMEPALHCARPGPGCEAKSADRIVVSRLIYRMRDPHRGDIVAFRAPTRAVACGLGGGIFVKRIIVLPGERWAERNGYIYVNGKKLNEPYVKPHQRFNETRPELQILKDDYIVLGDNRSASCDSRIWGTVPRSSLIGPVIAVYWPVSRISIR
jgi:signal peptidase I